MEFQDVFVTNVMSEPAESVPRDAMASIAASRLIRSDIGSLLVDIDSAPPNGIVTETDFVELVASERDPGDVTVGDCMSSPVVTVSSDERIGSAAETMAEHGIKKLPVIESESDAVIGIVTTTDIANYIPIHEFHPDETA